MLTSIYRFRFLALLFCIVFPLYLAIRGSALLSDITILLFSLSERASALHIKLASPPDAPPASISTEAFTASADPAKSVHVPGGGRRKKEEDCSLPDGLAHCINSFEQYPFLAEQVLQRKHARYSRQAPVQKAMSDKLGYPAHFDKARKGIEVNSRLAAKIAQIAREDYHTNQGPLEAREDAEFGVADLAFGHLSRDWSTQGAKERQAVFPPIIDGLDRHFGGNGRGNKVLVPGSGTGRLASDIADLGAFPFIH